MITTTIKKSLALLVPPPDLLVSEWADKYRVLSPEASAETGKWQTSRAEYQRGIMDAVNDPTIETIVIMTSAQVGKTEILLNTLGYYIDCDPAPILFLQPTLDMAQAVSKDRLAPLFRDCPTLTDKVKDPRSRDSDNSILHKKFSGGHVTLAGSNSPASLASRPIRIILADEIDRYPFSAGTEGDPVNLAVKRTTTFWNRKIILCSTPTVKGSSRIETAYESSDQRKYYIKCKHCNHPQILKWSNVIFTDSSGITNPDTAFYECEQCKGILTDQDIKIKGEWKATKSNNGIAGFHLNELYSPWSSMSSMAKAFLEAKKSTETLKTFINTSLAETFEETVDTQEVQPLFERKEDFTSESIPQNVIVLTCGVDVQADRLVAQVIGWGIDSHSYVIDYHTIMGLTSQIETWTRLNQYLLKKWKHESGHTLSIAACFVDSGYNTSQAYDFCKDKENRLVYPIKGQGKDGLPLFSISKNRNDAGVRIIHIGVNNCKSILYSRLKLEDKDQSGYIHFNKTLNFNYFEELTSEHLSVKFSAGKEKREWKKVRERNEALDTYNYALAAVEMLEPDFEYLKNKLTISISGEINNPEIKQQPQPKMNIIQNNSWNNKRW